MVKDIGLELVNDVIIETQKTITFMKEKCYKRDSHLNVCLMRNDSINDSINNSMNDSINNSLNDDVNNSLNDDVNIDFLLSNYLKAFKIEADLTAQLQYLANFTEIMKDECLENYNQMKDIISKDAFIGSVKKIEDDINRMMSSEEE